MWKGTFWDKYPDIVKVYTIQDHEGKVWSREVCGGPHVADTTTLGRFSIQKKNNLLLLESEGSKEDFF
ncbi:hypothetical protein ACFSQ7_25060 [Paenibacillus rhizoplanae]